MWYSDSVLAPARIHLVSDLWSGHATVRPLHTLEQIQAIYGTTQLLEGDWGVAWSPDSTWIAYDVLFATNAKRIYVAKSDGSGDVRDITEGISPSWSPDSKYLVYAKDISPGIRHIFRIDLEGGAPVDLSASSGPNANDYRPAWVR